MSHLASRVLADRLASATVGLPAVIPYVQAIVEDDEVTLPASLTIYDDTRHLRQCSMLAELPDRMTYPCIRVMTQSVTYAGGVARGWSDAVATRRGTVSLVAQLLLRDIDPAAVAATGMYLLRAMCGVVDLLNVDTVANRTRGGIVFDSIARCDMGQVDAPLGDVGVSPGSLVIDWPIIESVPLTAPL